MRLPRKGMVAMMDAMLFIVMIGITVSTIFVYIPSDDGRPSAHDIHNELFSTSFQASDIFDIGDDQRITMSEAIAVHLVTEKGDMEGFIETVLREMVPISMDFVLRCAIDGNVMIIGEGTGAPFSSYEVNFETVCGTLVTSLTLY